jgi:uncharacterized protein YbjT (DUF2867 family)
VRAAQFHEFVGQLMDWGRQGEVAHVPDMRTQLVSARAVAETLVDVATDPEGDRGPVVEVAGPREERLGAMAELLAARRGDGVQVRAGLDPSDPEHVLYGAGALLPSANAILAGPTFAEWVEAA